MVVKKGDCMRKKSSDATGDDDIILRNNLRAFVRDSVKTLEETLAEIELGRFDETPNLARLIRELNAARLELLKLENRLSKEQDEFDGGGGAAALDYDAIRDAIGRRLDRLRNAKAAAEISEQPKPG